MMQERLEAIGLPLLLDRKPVTTNGSVFGYDGNIGVISAFVDGGDPGTSNDTDAIVSDFSWAMVGTEIQGTFEISTLDPGEEIVVKA